MVTLTTDQTMLTVPDYLIKVGGDYNDNDLVEVYKQSQPEQIVAFFAIFIATGIQP